MAELRHLPPSASVDEVLADLEADGALNIYSTIPPSLLAALRA